MVPAGLYQPPQRRPVDLERHVRVIAGTLTGDKLYGHAHDSDGVP